MGWLWGKNDRGQLGHGLDVKASSVPRPLQTPADASPIKFAKISLGGFHSAAVDNNGQLFTWGDNKRGQCGQGDETIVAHPTKLSLVPGNPQCIGVACGGFFTLFQAAASTDTVCDSAKIYACGWGKEGCLGFGQACKRMMQPRPVPSPEKGY